MFGIVLTSGTWDLGNFLQNATKTLQTWGNYFIILLGVVMVVWAAWLIGKGLMTHGKGQPTNWFMAIGLLILGGAFMVGGFSWVSGIASSGKQTIDDLGTGTTILPMLQLMFPIK